MKVRPMLRGALWAGAILLAVLTVAGTLWVTLFAMGDQPGSQGAKGVALVALGCVVLDLIAVVVLLALAEIDRDGDPPRRTTEMPID